MPNTVLLFGWVNSRITSVLKDLTFPVRYRNTSLNKRLMKHHNKVTEIIFPSLLMLPDHPDPSPEYYIPFVIIYVVEPEPFDL